jgi:protein KRI1
LKSESEINLALQEMKELEHKPMEKDIDTFLIDYISKAKWIDKTDIKNFSSNNEDEYEVDDEEEELERTDKFESKYNFRFEELQEQENKSGQLGLRGIQVTGHSRSVEGSIRRVDDKRKLQREARVELKAKQRRQKEEELKRLKNLKRQEVVNAFRCMYLKTYILLNMYIKRVFLSFVS